MRISEFEWFVSNMRFFQPHLWDLYDWLIFGSWLDVLAQEVATEVFQFLQAVKEWYFGEIWRSKVGKGWAVFFRNAVSRTKLQLHNFVETSVRCDVILSSTTIRAILYWPNYTNTLSEVHSSTSRCWLENKSLVAAAEHKRRLVFNGKNVCSQNVELSVFILNSSSHWQDFPRWSEIRRWDHAAEFGKRDGNESVW